MRPQERLAELRRHLDRQGGRGVELAEEIDDLECELGDCVYTLEECRRKTHEGYSVEASEQDEVCRPFDPGAALRAGEGVVTLTQCDVCGDVANSEPGIRCGRTEPETWAGPCAGTYRVRVDLTHLADLVQEYGISSVLDTPAEALGLALAVLDQADAHLISRAVREAITLLEQAHLDLQSPDELDDELGGAQ